MNDDLEERLHRLRPAELPRDLLRGLRSAEPAARVKRPWPRVAASLGHLLRGWRLAGGGLVAASVVVFAVWSVPRPRLPGARMDADAGRPSHVTAPAASAVPRRENPVAGADPVRGVPGDFGGFRNGPFLTYAALSGGLNTRSGGGFHLEMPAGPIRLDCGYTPVGNDFNNFPFGKFNLNVNDSF